MDHAELGRLIRQLREDRGWSVRALAARSGVNPGTVSHAERGSTDRGLSRDSADALDRALGADGRILDGWHALPRARHAATAEPDLLPPAPWPVVGRREVLAAAEAALAEPAPVRSATVVITGPGGIGKTTAAAHAAHRVRRQVQGALWADLRGWDDSSGPRPLDSVLRSWCRALGAPESALAGDLDELIETWRRLGAGRRLVVVADNARPEQIQPLIPSRPDSLLLVTSRDRTTADGALHIDLPPLAEGEATELLAVRTGWPPLVVGPLVRPCGGMPLALVTAARDATAHWTQETVITMAHDLDAADELTPVDRATRQSYAQLSAEQQRVWRHCALIGGVLSEGQAAALAGTDRRTVRRNLAALVDACLLDRVPGGVDYLDPHREFARREGQRVDSQQERDAVLERGLTWLLHGLTAAAPHIAGRDDTPQDLTPLPDGVEPPAVHNYEQALAWSQAHWTYPAPVHAALERGWTRLAWQLVAAGTSGSYVIKPLVSWDRAAAEVLASVADLDTEGAAWCHHARGLAAGDAGDVDRAVRHLLLGLELRRELGERHRRDVGWSAFNAARWQLVLGADDDAIDPLITEGLAAHEAVGWTAGIMLGTSLRGALAARRGDWETAAEIYNEAQQHAPDVPDPAITVWTATALAESWLHIDPPRPDDAFQLAREADAHARDTDLVWGRISALVVMARAVPEQAADHLRLAAELAGTIGDPREADLRDELERVSRS
ncbi:helix-turn-helix transcriptional regulator [Saccharopolyspora taberi]|uniref:Tetratricopeptide repeat protein n=1 Tax=Saccharopolyspora taberi TaxID=60895 RepID=A0ABN3VCH3_9PSEU